jgi:hypothetical protein
MTYSKRDFEIMQDFHKTMRQGSRDTIEAFLKERNYFNVIDGLISELRTGTLGETGKNNLIMLLESVNYLRDELLAHD